MVKGSSVSGVNFEVKHGDIISEKADLILCCTDPDFPTKDSRSMLPAILKGGGAVVERACAKLQAAGPLADDGAIVIPAGSLNARYVILVRRPRNVDHCFRVLGAALQFAAQKHVKTLAIPVLRRDNSALLKTAEATAAASSMSTDGAAPTISSENKSYFSKELLVACMTDALVLAADRRALGRVNLVRLFTLKERDRDLLKEALSFSLSGRSAIENALQAEQLQKEAELERKALEEQQKRNVPKKKQSTADAIKEAINTVAIPVVSNFAGLVGGIVDAVGATAKANAGPLSSKSIPSAWEPMNANDKEPWKQDLFPCTWCRSRQ